MGSGGGVLSIKLPVPTLDRYESFVLVCRFTGTSQFAEYVFPAQEGTHSVGVTNVTVEKGVAGSYTSYSIGSSSSTNGPYLLQANVRAEVS